MLTKSAFLKYTQCYPAPDPHQNGVGRCGVTLASYEAGPRPNQERLTLAGGAAPLLVALSRGAGLRMAGK